MNTFEITIQRKSGDRWPIVAEHSRPGELLPIRSEGTLVVTLEDVQQLTSLLGRPKDYGTVLGKALFQGQIRDAFVSALRESENPLRVLLFLEAADSELKFWRWERLCAPIDGDWQLLALQQRSPFSFYIPAITDRRFPPIGRRDLRALVLVASPTDADKYNLAKFDAKATVDSVRTALGNIPTDVLATVEGAIAPPTLDALCSQLTDRTKQYTILHFVCHGKLLDDGETVLYWAKADNTVEPVTATRLLERLDPLRGARGLPHFAFLCACESASPGVEGGLGGLAQRLVRDLGMPAVVAMTDKVTIKTAQVLAENFYRQLKASGEVDIALHEATASLAERGDITVPALFSRLGARPLFSDQLDRALTNSEIEYGLEHLKKLLSERSPVLSHPFEEQAQKLRNIIVADVSALSKQARQEREQALTEIDNLCDEAIDISFHALALDKQPPNYDSRCPFLGLYPFRQENREFFFGRDELIAQLQQKLTEHNFLAVLGASGSGKSSLVLAGLIPALQQQQPSLAIAYMTPSSNPNEQLQISLSPYLENPSPNLSSAEREALNFTPSHEEKGVRGLRQSLILVIDQFEELFTLCTDEAQRLVFIEQVLSLTQQQKVVITMRADFWGECAPYQELKELMEARQKLIAPMNVSELRKAMEMQAAQVGLRFEAGLSNSILEDVQGEPGAMPLLQHALLELWKRRHGRWLRCVEYEAIGGVKKAISQTADDVYNRSQPEAREQIKNIFVRLTRLDEEAVQGEQRRDTRRRVGLEELVPVGGELMGTKNLVQRLAGEGARLVVTSVDESTNLEEVEVAHEALIRYWPRLIDWLNENRTGLQLRETIRQAAFEWEEKPTDENYLVHRGGRLEDAETLLKKAGFLNQLEANYISACVELRERSALEQEQRQQRELQREKQARLGWQCLAGAMTIITILFISYFAYREKLRLEAYSLGETVKIPAGKFYFGAKNPRGNEISVRQINLDDFEIDKHQVSNHQYGLCVSYGACSRPVMQPQLFLDKNNLDKPVVGVTAFQANDYCDWLGRRLPTELEWEKAARNSQNFSSTLPSWEWTSSYFFKQFNFQLSKKPWYINSEILKLNQPLTLRFLGRKITVRQSALPDSQAEDTGLRCAKSKKDDTFINII
ncbi:SUMF1/EgtB/PvdO family nonheme iron enzyme [Nostoc sp. FACHB-280]|uniref:nSTAND1 domain-containing NTPase n=1 Tax=Nostoc sp. FACHB-280 TaxID=2692839 RepID=UPI00168AB334|nr:SUMF1/EgtB/PvdO family nonheme iron enzyme [Nostoc sp. FACHB-280]MBD2494307.1 SUMF1/EgtB/PvdO family nonheme iron enzyme [Nostoc sp. FACHB-280]